MDHIGLRVLVTALVIIGGVGGGFAAASSNGWGALAGMALLLTGVGIRSWMLSKGWV